MSEATIELLRDDLLHMLAHQADDEVDDALLIAAVAMRAGPRLLVLDDPADLLRYESNDQVDDSPLLEIAATAVMAVIAPVAMVAAAMLAVVLMVVSVPLVALPPVVMIALAVVARPVLLVARPHDALQRFQAFENFASVVVPHEDLPVWIPP